MTERVRKEINNKYSDFVHLLIPYASPRMRRTARFIQGSAKPMKQIAFMGVGSALHFFSQIFFNIVVPSVPDTQFLNLTPELFPVNF